MPSILVSEIESNMEVETRATVQCSWCCQEKSVEVITGESYQNLRAAERLAQAFTYAKDEESIGFACKQCMATGTLKEVKDASKQE